MSIVFHFQYRRIVCKTLIFFHSLPLRPVQQYNFIYSHIIVMYRFRLLLIVCGPIGKHRTILSPVSKYVSPVARHLCYFKFCFLNETGLKITDGAHSVAFHWCRSRGIAVVKRCPRSEDLLENNVLLVLWSANPKAYGHQKTQLLYPVLAVVNTYTHY